MKRLVSIFLHQAMCKNRAENDSSIIAQARTMSTTRIATLTLLFILLAILPSQPSSATVPNASDQFNCTNVTEIPQLECEALVALYNETNGPNWDDNTAWLVTNTPCNWYGVGCSGRHIKTLNLGGRYDNFFGLQGAIPPEIGNLNRLKYLYLSYNQLSSLPPEIGNLNNLTYLFLISNQLKNLPTQIGRLGNLTILRLQNNELTDLPSQIGNLYNLGDLRLSDNQLHSLPVEIGNLNNLQDLWLAYNRLPSLPTEFSNLNQLTTLTLGNNCLRITDSTLLQWANERDSDWASTQAFCDVSPIATATKTAMPNHTPTATPRPTATATSTHTPTTLPPSTFPDIRVNPTILSITLLEGQSSTESFTIHNDGNANLTYEISTQDTTTVRAARRESIAWPADKVDGELRERVEKESVASFLVYLKEQANLDDVSQISDRVEQGKRVYNRLHTTAQEGQSDLLAWLGCDR